MLVVILSCLVFLLFCHKNLTVVLWKSCSSPIWQWDALLIREKWCASEHGGLVLTSTYTGHKKNLCYIFSPAATSDSYTHFQLTQWQTGPCDWQLITAIASSLAGLGIWGCCNALLSCLCWWATVQSSSARLLTDTKCPHWDTFIDDDKHSKLLNCLLNLPLGFFFFFFF